MAKVRDYTTNLYCDFLWVSDLLELKRNANNAFSLEVSKHQIPTEITVGNVSLFGTIVEVKQVGCNDFLYQLDDGTGVIACKHSGRQFEDFIRVIESEQVDILNHLSENQVSFEQSSVVDYSMDDSVFNDRSLQLEKININKKIKLKGLLTIWDDIHQSFNSLIEPYNIGDSVLIHGKLYTYFNMNQIYINKIRAVDLMEEIMLTSIKIEETIEHPKENKVSQIQSESEKRLSGLITFDNVSHIDPDVSIPRNIKTPDYIEKEVFDITPGIVTPNLEPTITFDTFTELS